MELTDAVSLFLVAYLSYLALLFARRKASPRGKMPPGPTPLPVIGNFLQIKASKTLQSLLKLQEEYGPVFTVYFGNRPVVVLCGYDAVKEALIDKPEEFSGRKTNPTLERTFQGHGVVFANGERWKQLRRFSLTVLRSFGMGKKSIHERIQEEAQFLPFGVSSSYNTLTLPSLSPHRETLQPRLLPQLRCLQRHLLHRLWQSLRLQRQGIPGSPEDDERQLSGNEHKLVSGSSTHLLAKIYDILEDMRLFIAKRVMKNKETLDFNSPRDFIDCFLIQMEKEKDNPASEFNLKNLELTTLTLFFAGTETVSSTLRYGFLLLMKFPKVQAKMHEEIDRVIGQNRVPNIEDRSQMPYVDAVIHEVQRFSDLIPMNVPHAVTRDTEFRGYVIPEGTEIYPLLSTVLHDCTKFKSPIDFNPENFLDENGCLKKNEAFVPFSSGKRICLGEGLARMELFLFFTTILQRFRLKPVMDPQDIDLMPQEFGFATIPPLYELSVVQR